jgi:ATP-dependent helicase/nuclease subunit B
MTTRAVPWARLDDLVPDQFDQYWQLTLRFLQIARQQWPAILRERGQIEAAARRDALIKAESARLGKNLDRPVIAAGSTGSIPSTAELMATIARLPRGAVVLPGLDTHLDEGSWRLIAGSEAKKVAPAPGHPQFAMHALLRRIGVERDSVVTLAAPGVRDAFISEALRPAATTERWQKHAGDLVFDAQTDAALAAMAVIEAANPEDEALAIAVTLREAVDENKTAALVTPDRALASRVSAALLRWGIAADDSSGEALIETPAGIFARLVAEAAIGGLEPVTLLALLKHPLFDLGLGDQERAVAALECAILRGPRPRAGSAGLARALTNIRAQLEKLHRGETSELHRSDPRTALTAQALQGAGDLVARLADALRPLECLKADAPLGVIAARHREVVAALSRETALSGFAGGKLAQAFDDLSTSQAAADIEVKQRDYGELFSAALAGRVVRPPPLRDAKVRIFGLLEARLTESDRVVLGGLVEGTWPPESRTDSWLSRPMRLALGLDLPERRIGLTAHDFAQLLGAREVILTHAGKIAGAPTVPSRFIQRLAALAGARWAKAVERGSAYLDWARELDRPDRVTPAPQPAPKPPRAARPASLSVTEIEDWLRDPYTIYARHVLRLRPLDAVDVAPGAAERGSIIHAAVGDFTKAFAAKLPDNPAAELIALGEPHFAALDDFPEARAFWWPRFVRIAHWFADWDARRRGAISGIVAEIRGEIEIPLPNGTFRLRGVADRIERTAEGRYIILDYKTGSARTEKQVRSGIAPQLTLEAAILRRGGFEAIPSDASVAEITYVLLKGGEPAGVMSPIVFKDGATPDAEADRAYAKLAALAARFADESEPYRSLVHPMWRTRYGDYDHLARVKEWASAGGEIDDFGGGE